MFAELMALPDLMLRFHKDRDRLLAEAHARPSTPIAAPALAARIVSLSGEAGEAKDRAHMAALCRKFAAPEPGEGARWCLLDAGSWSLRWERHTEVSAWTAFRPGIEPDVANFGVTALDKDSTPSHVYWHWQKHPKSLTLCKWSWITG